MREDDRLVGLMNLEAELHVGGAERPVERQLQAAARERQLDRLDIGDRLLGAEALAVAEREGLAVLQMKPLTLLFAVGGLERGEQVVRPGPGGGDDLCL